MEKEMVEVRWHGRGGQGVVTASEALASSALKEDKYIQSFPEFGPERMGAPVRAFTRISNAPIDIHSQVYEPDVVVVLDPTLLESIPVAEGLDEDGILLVNTDKSEETMRKKTGFKGKIYVLDATKIATETIGRPIANTPCLGAVARLTGVVKKENVIEQIKKIFGEKLSKKALDGNINAINRAYEEVMK
jgi:pyruvate ferredoxin oxidoreductase gamma subunit